MFQTAVIRVMDERDVSLKALALRIGWSSNRLAFNLYWAVDLRISRMQKIHWLGMDMKLSFLDPIP